MKRPAILILALVAVAAAGCGGEPEGSGTTSPDAPLTGIDLFYDTGIR